MVCHKVAALIRVTSKAPAARHESGQPEADAAPAAELRNLGLMPMDVRRSRQAAAA